MTVKVFAPASVGNFIIGFDVLGLAIACDNLLGDFVTVEQYDCLHYSHCGPYAQQLPSNEADNLGYKALIAYHDALTKQKLAHDTVHLSLEKRLPVGSGLGSSSSSIVAALVALNLYYKEPLEKQQLLQLAGQLEGSISGSIHFDNVAPCLLGSLQMMSSPTGKCHRLDPPSHWHYVICYPGICITTQQARSVLPSNIELDRAIDWNQRLANFVFALLQKERDEVIKPLLVDEWITPHRKHLIPHYDETQAHMLKAGVLAFGIAGAGPSMLAVCQSTNLAIKAKKIFENCYSHHPNSFVHHCQIDSEGARQIV